jgi:GNAT superfamily N-acetyltransferase
MDARPYRRSFTLRNGVAMTLRAIRPDDGERLRTAFHRLDPRTVYKRFFGAKHDLSDRELTAATAIDFDTVVALVAVLDSDPDTIIGGGRYARLTGAGSADAEVAFTVEEDYQGLGIASLILRELCAIARAAGIDHFVAEVLPSNTPMLQVFRNSGLVMSTQIDAGIVHVTLDL